MDNVNEKTTYFVTVTFKDEDGILVTPTAAWYSLYCETCKQEILIETAFPSLATSVEITVTALQNAIRKASHNSEQKLMTVRFTYGGGEYQGTSIYRWKVINLKRIS